MAVDPRQAILQMMMQQGGGGGGGMPDPMQMANMARSMNELGTRQRPSESGGGGGGGGLPFGRGRSIPPQAPPAMGPPIPQGVPAQPYEGMSQGYPEQELMDEGAGLPPQIMAMAAAGIRPQDVMRGGMMGGRGLDDRARPPGDVDPMESYGNPKDAPIDDEIDSEDERNVPPMEGGPKYDPRFGPIKDKSREETEGEIDAVRNSMSERSIQAIEDDIREAAETGDTSAIEVLLEEMEEQGYEVAELPPDVQKMINIQDEENVRETEEPEED
jgi:hypothetical protein